jgi:hypothetical protein
VIKEGDHLNALDLTHDDIVDRLGTQVQQSKGKAAVEDGANRCPQAAVPAKPVVLTVIARFGSRLPWCVPYLRWANHSLCAATHREVSGRARPAHSEAVRVFGTGAACCRFD